MLAEGKISAEEAEQLIAALERDQPHATASTDGPPKGRPKYLRVVVDSAVQSASKDKVVVLLFVDQSVSNTTVPDPRIDRSRIKMTMEKVDGQWRASKVELA